MAMIPSSMAASMMSVGHNARLSISWKWVQMGCTNSTHTILSSVSNNGKVFGSYYAGECQRFASTSNISQNISSTRSHRKCHSVPSIMRISSHQISFLGRRSMVISSQTLRIPSEIDNGTVLKSMSHGTSNVNATPKYSGPSVEMPLDPSSPSSAASVKISMDELLALASCQPTPLSLEAMYRYGEMPKGQTNKQKDNSQFVDVVRLRNAQFLHRELPIRIAQRAIDLLTLPHGLNRTKEVQAVANAYLQYLQLLRGFSMPTNAESEQEFTDALRKIVMDRHSIPIAIAKGLQSLKDDRKAPIDARRLAEMEEALNRFFTARVGVRFLTEHHILTANAEDSDDLYRKKLEAEGGLELLNDETYASASDEITESCGCIQKNCDPVKEVRRTAARVVRLCRESYGIAPEIEILDCTHEEAAEVPFTYVPHHLRYMLAELIKNSCRATVRSYLSGTNSQKEDHSKHHNDPDGGIHDAPSLPPIKIVVTKGAEDVTIKVADRGGGMPRSVMKRIWTFAHSTLCKEGRTQEDKFDFGKDEFTGGHIRGFGLPLARIYARYFGGEVTIKSMEGYGVDAYLYLPVLGVACENLPQRVIRSPGNLDSSHSATGEVLDGEGYYEGDDASGGYVVDGCSRNDDFFQDSIQSSKQSALLDTLDEKAL